MKAKKTTWITVRMTPALKKKLLLLSKNYGVSLASLSTMAMRMGVKNFNKLKVN